jgi:DNA-binding response OmpR family regulator
MQEDIAALQALSEQHGVPGIDLNQVAISVEHLSVIPKEVAESRQILCVLSRGERLFLAMVNPLDRRVIEEVEFATGRKVYPYVALPHSLKRTIKDAYEAKARGDKYFLGPSVPDETLRSIGVSVTSRAARPIPPGAQGPAPPKSVVDERMQRAADRTEISVSDFGSLSADVSTVTALPDELNAANKAASGAKGPLVFVVDDEQEIRQLLQRVLHQKGFRVLEADRGSVALRLLKEQLPDVIVLDATLPEIHGFDIARRLKGSERYGRIPIIMISAVYKGWHIAEDLKSNYGIDEYIEKPFKIGDVVSTIERVLAAAKTAKVEHAPRNVEALSADAERALNDGVAAYKRGDVDAAVEHLRRGIAIDPLAYRLHFHLALLYGRKGLVHEAIHELEKAVDLNPKHFPGQKNLAVLYEKAGFKHKAVEVWTRCAQIAPDDETRAQVKKHLIDLI